MAEKEDAAKLEGKKEKPESTADLLIDNFVALQKVLADVSVKLASLAEQISSLLKLFEASAKSFKEKKEREKIETRGITDKLNELVEQNKTIAKGLSFVEEEMAAEKAKPKPLPEFK